MTFRASSEITSNALSEIKFGAVRAKALAQQMVSQMSGADTSAQTLLNLLHQIRTLIERWAILSTTPGLAGYARDQENDPGYDVVVEFLTMRTALITVRDRIIAELPKATDPVGVGGRLAVYTLTANGDLVAATFTPPQTASLRADLDAFIASVE